MDTQKQLIIEQTMIRERMTVILREIWEYGIYTVWNYSNYKKRNNKGITERIKVLK